VRGKERGRPGSVCARADGSAAVAAIFGALVPAFSGNRRSSIPASRNRCRVRLHHLLGRQLRAVLALVEIDPVLRELVAAVLSREQPAGGIECKPLAVADTSCVTFFGGELLSCLVGVIAPRAAASLLLRTGPIARRSGIRFLTSQAFVADPMSTNRLPCAS